VDARPVGFETPFRLAPALCTLFVTPVASGCDSPNTNVVLDNAYSPSATDVFVVYRGFWQAVPFETPAASSPPRTFVVLQSRDGFEVHLNETLHIPVDDTTFMGNCDAGSFLSQSQVDFITQRVFADAGLRYEAATCQTTGAP
jgi:hypothetical protein